MSDVLVQIRDMKFTVLDNYLKFRVIDAGCPYENPYRDDLVNDRSIPAGP